MPSDAPGSPLPGYPPQQTIPAPSSGGRVRGTLAGRISLVTTVVALLTAMIVALVALPLIQRAAKQEAQQYLSQVADTLASSLERTDSTNRALPRLGVVLRSQQVEIQRVFAGGTLPSYLSQAQDNELLTTGRLSTTAQRDGRQIFVEGRVLADGSVMILDQPDTVRRPTYSRGIFFLAMALIVGAIIGALAGLLLARRLARPLQQAARAAEQMSQGERNVAIPVEGPVEVAEVGEALNDLNSALAISEARQREFLLSVSHELRTPMTSISGYAEALADGVVAEQDVPATAQLMVGEAGRLDRLVSDLLDLARMGAREVRIHPVELDVAEILADAAAVWGDMCQAEAVEFEAVLPPPPVMAVTDGVRLRQIVDNLMANALRMTPSGRPVVLAAKVTEDTIVVEVRDGGPGLTPDDISVAFEPAELYSRYEGVRKVGSGVGLALVGRLAERLGGGAVAGVAPEGGASFTITIARRLSEPDAAE